MSSTGPCTLIVVGLLAFGALAHEPQGTSGQPPAQPAAGQPPAAQQQPPPKFRTGAELVRVDAVVLDRNGQPVTSLTSADFELQEGGVTQEIRTFQYVRADGQPDADDELSLPIRSRSHAATEASKDNVRLFLIFWDEYHIGQMMSANRARASLMQFVRTAFGPTDIVGFMDPLTPIDSIQFTRDRLELFERTRRLVGRSGVYVPTRSVVEDAQLQRGDVERLRSEVTISALKSAVVHLGGIRDGRKSIILISEGLRGIMRDGQSLLTDLVRAANDNNTAIYSIDPRGFGTSRFASMFEPVSQDTGGQYFRSNDLVQALRQVVTQSSGFYLLGYTPAPNPMDGKFHKIRVRVKPSGLDVRARSGYWAPSVSDIERARIKAADAEMPPDVQRALSELPSENARRSIDLWIGASVDPEGPTVRVSWVPRAAGSGPGAKPLHVAAVAARDNLTVFEGNIASEGTAFRVVPGPLKLTITVTDSGGDLIDRDVKTIDVPDPAATALAIGTPALFRTQNALELRNLDRSPAAMPFAGREFLRTDRLFVRFTVYGAAASTAKVATRIISQWGKDLAELPVSRRSPDQNHYEIDLPLSSVARGEFLIAITATAGSESVRTFVPIRILR